MAESRTFRAIPTLVLASFVASGLAHGQDSTASKDFSDISKRVYDGLTELSRVRAKVLKKYSYLARGEMSVSHPADQVVVHPFFMIRTEDRTASFAYAACGEVRLAEFSGDGVDRQTWTEFLRAGQRIKVRRGPVRSGRQYALRDENEELVDFDDRLGIRPPYLDPFDDIVLVANTIWSPMENVDAAEQLFINKCDLVDAQMSLQDQILSTWKVTGHDGEYTVKLYQSRINDYLPVRVEYAMKGKHFDFASTTTCRWQKHNGTWVPEFIDASCPINGSKSGVDHRWVITIDWLIGDEVPAEFFRHDLQDQREPTRKHFDAGFARVRELGGVMNPPWERPAQIERAYLMDDRREVSEKP